MVIFTRKTFATCFFAALWLATPLVIAPAWASDPPAPGSLALRGLPLHEALLVLQEHGLKIAFTSYAVKPEMRVRAEPKAQSWAEILEELLAPHGLRAEVDRGGLYVVVPGAPAVTGVMGEVRIRRSLVPLAGARILVPEEGREEIADDDGRFEISGMTAGIYTFEVHLPGFVVERRDGVVVESAHLTELVFELAPAPIPLDEIVVTPSQVSLLRTDPFSTLAFDRDEILALPHLGDDLFRALTWLPGVSGQEISAEFSVRGGRPDEVLVLLDGIEVFEPYHAKDFSNLLSIIAPQAIAEVDLILGGFPARYGDRMGGVLEMNTVRPEDEARTRLGVSIFTAQVSSSGIFRDSGADGDQGTWLVTARRGGVDLIEEYLDDEERPEFWDVFGKASLQLGPRQQLSAHVLHGDDEVGIFVVEDDTVSTNTTYDNSYAWLNHQAMLFSDLFFTTGASAGQVRQNRQSTEFEEGETFSVRDERDLDVFGLKQDWNLDLSTDREGVTDHYLQWGFDVRRLDMYYDYVSLRELEDPLGIRTVPRTGTTIFREGFSGDQVSVYVSDRLRLAKPLTLELGLRYDEQTITNDRNLSPRVNLVYALGETSALRASWGHYTQSQRVYELQIEDGDSRFSPAELTKAILIGFERVFRGGTSLQVNAYHRDISDPRRRYENIFEPKAVFPEVEPDRVLIAPERSRSRGFEIFTTGKAGPRLDWWASYAWAEIEDEIDGRDVPRGIDQTHTFNIDFNYRVHPHWTLNFAWRYHTGWPTTAIGSAVEEDDEGELEVVPVFGLFNAERLPDYHRLDLRASRTWGLKRGNLTFFLELQNIYNRKNQAGIDVDLEFEILPDGTVLADPEEEPWGGFLPSFGIDWEF